MKIIQCSECLDSDELAQENRANLCLERSFAAELGRGAIRAVQKGSYLLPDGTRIDWSDAVAACKGAVRSIPPSAELPLPLSGQRFHTTWVRVSNQTTSVAARVMHLAGRRPLVLNFANGIQPGGGFLIGARAQEEVLCRSSALHATLEGDSMYEVHRKRPVPDFSSWAILSPRVPVFRTDAGVSIPWWPLDILTCAAPYAPRIGQQCSAQLLQLRIERVLQIAAAFGYRNLVLGAWGCGAFGNDPFRTAHDFREALQRRFGGVFEEVVFAITDWTEDRRFLGPFRDTFSEIR